MRDARDPGGQAAPAVGGGVREHAAADGAASRDAGLDGATLAHELKNPLTAVKALVQLGLANPREAASHERLEQVARAVERMERILRDYLASARGMAELAPARVEVGPLVSGVLQGLSARASEARVRLVTHGDATVEADPRRLEEALVNLVANGIEATPPGGEVAVEVLSSAEGAELVVRDTGSGIAPDALQRLGTPFFSTRSGGNGLGVAHVRSVIAMHGGSLRYESEPGKGTVVRATLPRRARAA
ncbi:sensor histidine kinase [Anaeromyxobacter sp. Red801]|uniref:sensor histidine kinase n=1 Tax=Anaeromyxobacter sp. Red801 TaxID=3411632 RepID=UPI003B9E958C